MPKTKGARLQIGKNAITDDNFADLARAVIEDNKSELFGGLTTTQLRNIYANITNVMMRVNNPESFAQNSGDIQYLKVKIAYAAGRDAKVKDFVSKTGLLSLLDSVRDYEGFRLYCRYAESLVAYFKFYGGRD